MKDLAMRMVFFRRPKPKQFGYKPMYYDAEKEELVERRKELEGISAGDPRARLKADIRRKWKRDDQKNVSSTYSGVRIIIYLFIIVLSVYFIFFTDFIQGIFQIFGGK